MAPDHDKQKTAEPTIPEARIEKGESTDIEEIRRFMQGRVNQWKESSPRTWSPNFFMNLKLSLPGKDGKKQLALFDKEILDLPYGSGPNSTEMSRTKTIGEYYHDAAEAVKENGVDMNRVDELLKILEQPYVITADEEGKEHRTPREKLAEDLDELFTLLEPIYITLRKMGYNHYDITGDRDGIAPRGRKPDEQT